LAGKIKYISFSLHATHAVCDSARSKGKNVQITRLSSENSVKEKNIYVVINTILQHPVALRASAPAEANASKIAAHRNKKIQPTKT
jgi:hypothetical protein